MTVVASKYARLRNDLYQTEPYATNALLRHFPVKGLRLWNPGAGNHLMSDVMREAGADIVASDIQTYDRPHDFEFDFLENRPEIVTPVLQRVGRIDGIFENPPYGHCNATAVKFTERALERCDGMVAMLLTMKFDSGKGRVHLFRDNPRYLGKIVLLDRLRWFPGQEDQKNDGTEDHAWQIWGPTPWFRRHPRTWWEARRP